MIKKALIMIVAVLILTGANVYAGNGDLIVNGEIQLGTGHLSTTNPNGALVLNAGPNVDGNAGIWFRKLSVLGDVSGYVDLMRITSDGNVGIGTTDLHGKLNIKSGWGDWITLEKSQDNGFWHIHNPQNGDRLEIGYYDGTQDHWGYFVINNSGNVGIGTTDPGNDKLDVRGRAYASGGWQTTNADYAEWFEKEEDTGAGDLIGIDLETGKIRKYQYGDKLIGIHASNPSIVGNRLKETDEEMEETHTLVSLLGQVEFNPSQVIIDGRIVKTVDGKEVGILLSNGKIFIGR